MIGMICWKEVSSMNNFSQGDIIKIDKKKNLFLIVSNNTFIKATNAFHICPIIDKLPANPIHVSIEGKNKTTGTVLCEQLLLVVPNQFPCTKIDSISYPQIMNISDILQGIFEYD